MSHTLTMSSMQNGYKLGATYIGTKQISPTEAFPVVLGDVDPAGNVNFNLIHQLTPEIRVKGAAQVSYKIPFKIINKIFLLKEFIVFFFYYIFLGPRMQVNCNTRHIRVQRLGLYTSTSCR